MENSYVVRGFIPDEETNTRNRRPQVCACLSICLPNVLGVALEIVQPRKNKFMKLVCKIIHLEWTIYMFKLCSSSNVLVPKQLVE